MRSLYLSMFSVAALLTLSACGSDEKPAPQLTVVTAPPAAAGNAVMPTKGQQLQDLQKAYDEDAISKDEYNAQKARLLVE